MSAINLHSLEDTEALAARLAARLKAGDAVALQGDLGTGKTAFARALIQQMSAEAVDVTSPTFTLLQTYPTAQGEIFHYDLYRIAHPSELEELGLDEAQRGIMLVEWPERLGGYKLPITYRLHFTLANEARSVTVTPSL